MTSLHAPRTYDVCGVPIAAVTPQDAAEAIVAAAVAGTSYEAHLCNAYTLSLVGNDERLRNALTRAHLNLPDGTPVAWLGRRHGTTGSVRGPSLVLDVARAGVRHGVAHYLYGGAPGVADDMARELRRLAPGVTVVAAESPPYHALDDGELAALATRVRESGAGVVWVGIGTPKQDYLVPRLAEQVEAAVVPVGAAFDLVGGRVREAPAVLHGSGLEWIYRLCREPRRLWRRYLLGNPRFVVDAIRARRRP